MIEKGIGSAGERKPNQLPLKGQVESVKDPEVGANWDWRVFLTLGGGDTNASGRNNAAFIHQPQIN